MRYNQSELQARRDAALARFEELHAQYPNCRWLDDRDALAALPVTLFQAQLDFIDACWPARQWVGAKSAREAYNTCPDVNWLAYVIDMMADEHVMTYYPGLNITKTADKLRAEWPFERFQKAVAEHTALRAKEDRADGFTTSPWALAQEASR